MLIGLALFITLAPWMAMSFLGGALGAKLFYKGVSSPDYYNLGHARLLSAGLAGCVAYTVLGLIAWCLSVLQVPHPLTTAGVVCILVCVIVGYRTNLRRETAAAGLYDRFGNAPWSSWLMMLVAMLVAAALCYLIWQTPIFGWDVLDYWGPQTAAYVQACFKNSSFSTSYLQPPVWMIAVTWGGCAQEFLELQPDLSFTFKIICVVHYLSALLVIIAWALYETGNHVVAIIASLIFVNVPLAESHMVLVGYAEPILGCVLLAASTVTAIGLRHGRSGLIVFGLSIATLMLALKNIGVLFFLALALVSLFSSVRRRVQLALGATIIACCTLFVVGQMPAISVPIGGGALSYDPIDHVVWLGYRAMEISTDSNAIFFDNFFHAHIINASFGLAFLVAVIAVGSFLVDKIRGMRVGDDAFFVWLFFVSLFLVACIQILDYGLRVSMPDQDTGLTRFSLPSYFLIPLVVISLFLEKPAARSCSEKFT